MVLTFAGSALAQDDLTTFILVRHAEKANDGTNNPGLTEEGTDRANRLKNLLSKAEIGAIYSTPFKRTMNTVAPLATKLGLDIEEYNPRGREFITTMFEKYKGKTIVVSGHSNTTPVVANILIGDQKFKNLSESEYDKIFVVTVSSVGKGTVTVMSY